MNFNRVKVGDQVIRSLCGIEMSLKVTKVDDELIHCGGWTFDRETGAEVDHGIQWGPMYGRTGSRLIHWNPADPEDLIDDIMDGLFAKSFIDQHKFADDSLQLGVECSTDLAKWAESFGLESAEAGFQDDADLRAGKMPPMVRTKEEPDYAPCGRDLDEALAVARGYAVTWRNGFIDPESRRFFETSESEYSDRILCHREVDDETAHWTELPAYHRDIAATKAIEPTDVEITVMVSPAFDHGYPTKWWVTYGECESVTGETEEIARARALLMWLKREEKA